MTARVQSVSSFVVSPCGQRLLGCSRVADFEDLTNATLLNEAVGPNVDAVLSSSKCVLGLALLCAGHEAVIVQLNVA